MDPISISASSISIANLAFQVGKALYGFYASSKTVDKTIQEMYSGIIRIEELCRHIDKHIKLFPQAESCDIDNEDLFQGIQSQLSDCSKVINRINSKLKPMVQDGTGTWTQMMHQWRFNMRQEDINECRTQIQIGVQNLQISLQLVNLQATYLAPKLANKDLLEKLKEIQTSLDTHGVDQQLRGCAGVYLQRGTTLYTRSVTSSVGGRQDVSHPKAIADWLEQMNSLRIHGNSASSSSPFSDDLYSSTSQLDQTEDSNTPSITDLALSTLNPIQGDDEDEFACEVVEAAIKSSRRAYNAANYLEAEEILKECLALIQQLPKNQQQQLDFEEIHFLLALCAYHNHDLLAAEAALISALERDTEADIHAETRFLAAEFLTMVYVRLGKYDLARITCDNVYRGRRKLFGKENDASYGTIALLVRIYELQELSTRASIYRSMIPDKERDKFCTRYKDLSDNGLCASLQQIEIAPEQNESALPTEIPIRLWKNPPAPVNIRIPRHSTWINSNNGDKIALSIDDGNRHAKIEIYRTRDGFVLRKLSVQNETVATAFGFHDDGQRLASAHGGFWYSGVFSHYKPLSIYIWDILNGHRLQKFTPISNQTHLWISKLLFHQAKLEFLRCLPAKNSPKDDLAPGFMAIDLGGSVISDIKGEFSLLQRSSRKSRRIVLKDVNEFKVLDTADYTVVKRIRNNEGVRCVICTNDDAVLVLHYNGKLETYKDDIFTSQQLTAISFSMIDNTSPFRDGYITCVSERTIIILPSSEGFYIISLEDQSYKEIQQASTLEGLHCDANGKYLFILERRSYE